MLSLENERIDVVRLLCRQRRYAGDVGIVEAVTLRITEAELVADIRAVWPKCRLVSKSSWNRIDVLSP